MKKIFVALTMMLPVYAYANESQIPSECNDLFKIIDQQINFAKERKLTGVQSPEALASTKATMLESIEDDPIVAATECKQLNEMFTASGVKVIDKQNDQSIKKNENAVEHKQADNGTVTEMETPEEKALMVEMSKIYKEQLRLSGESDTDAMRLLKPSYEALLKTSNVSKSCLEAVENRVLLLESTINYLDAEDGKEIPFIKEMTMQDKLAKDSIRACLKGRLNP